MMNRKALVEPRSYRRAFMDVSPDLLLELLKVGPDGVRVGDRLIRAFSDPIPEDARVVHCGVTERGDIRIILESDTFDPVLEAYLMRQLCPKYEEEDLGVSHE